LEKLKLNKQKKERETVNVGTKQTLTRDSKWGKKKKKILQPAQFSLCAWIMAARKRKEQVGTSENIGDVSINTDLQALHDKLV
jgi:hypothetical protein